MATRVDEVRRSAAEALADGDRIAGREPKDYSIDEDKTAIAELRRHAQLLLQMSYSRAVDNYLAYLSELLWLLYSERPETLRARVEDTGGGEKVALDVVLEHSTMDDLVGTLVEQRVTDLSFKGVRSLADYLGSRLKFDLYSDEERFHRAMAIVELRNLIVHNRAVVNRLYLSRVPDSPFALGDAVKLDVDDFFADIAFLAESVVDIDTRAVEKWGLTTVAGTLDESESGERRALRRDIQDDA
jgi:hypothetical protein